MEASCTARPIGADIATPAPVDKSRCSDGYGDALAPDQAVQAEKKTAPPKRWRNKYVVIVAHENVIGWVTPGEIVWGFRCYPSKEIAEQAAYDARERGRTTRGHRSSWADGNVEYLDAFPVEEGQ